MSSDSDDQGHPGQVQGHSDPASDYSDEDEMSRSPEVWQAPNMSRTMKERMDLFDKEQTQGIGGKSGISADFVSSLSRVSGKVPPPVPPKSFTRKADSSEKESPSDIKDVENMEIDDQDENKTFIIHGQMDEGENTVRQEESKSFLQENENIKESQVSVKDRAKMFEQKENPFAALKKPAVDLPIEEQALEPRTAELILETSVENSSDIYISSKITDNTYHNQGQHTEGQDHPGAPPDKTSDPPVVRPGPDQAQGPLEAARSPWKKDENQHQPPPENILPWQQTQPQQPESHRSYPWPQELHGEHNQPAADRTSPRPQHPSWQYPGPQPLHGWPGVPPPPAMYRQPYGDQPPYKGTPPSGIPRLVYPYNRGPPPPEQHQHGITPGYFGPLQYYPYSHQYPEGMPPHQFGHEQGPHIEHQPSGDTPPGHPQAQTHVPHQPSADDQNQKTTYQTPVPSKAKNPKTKQFPVGKGDNASGQKPGGRSPSATTPKKSDVTPGVKKGTPGKDTNKGRGSNVEVKSPTSTSKKPEKYYVCVYGIDEGLNNGTFFDYLEARSKGEIDIDESLRTEDQPEHAIVVFEDKIDLKNLKEACRKRKIGQSSLAFDELDPPRSIIASSLDDKLSKSAMEDFLSRKKIDFLRVRATEDGSVVVKFKTMTGVTAVMEETNIKIGGSNAVISIMFTCDHGTFYDLSLHRVSIPSPYKPLVPDRHIKKFLIDISSTCNEQLGRHHARLATTDELHIECTIDPKDRSARQKVKDWKNNVQKAWEEFVTKNAQKKELEITHDMKDLLLEHINQSRATVKSETLTVISPDETGNMTFIFVGEVQTVENFHCQISAKKTEIQETLNRKKRMKTETMNLKPLEIALMLKENEIEQLKEIASDFNYKIDEEIGVITFDGVDEDISAAKVKIFEVKNSYHSWTVDPLSLNQCKLLSNPTVSDIVNEKLCDENIKAVFAVGQGQVNVCATTQDDCRRIGNVFKDTILEDELKLDDTSRNVLTLDEWAEEKVSLTAMFPNIVIINDSADDRIVVTATSEVMDVIMDELENFITDHSIYEKEIKINEEAEFKFLEIHCKDFVKDLEVKNSDQNLKIQFSRQSINVSGTQKAIDIASSEINDQIRKIQTEQYTISKPGVDSLFSDDSKSDSLIAPVEEDSRTVITVDANTVKKQAFQRNTTIKGTDEDYVWQQAAKNYKRKGTKSGKGGPARKAGPVVCKNGTKIILVKKEDLGKQKADVIICSTNGQLDLSGPAGKSIVRGAGPEIEAEIKLNHKDGIEHGDIAVVKGYKLHCKEVYLAALPGWKSGGEQIISKCVNTCLVQAQSYKSIVFPALGTGNLHYPRDLVAKTMYECVSKFDQGNKTLKEVKFLCYDDDTIKAFEREEFNQVNPGVQLPPPPVGYYKKHNINVKVVKGDLGQQQVDVLVSAVPKDLNLESAGGAGISLMKGLGQNIQVDITNQHPSGVASGGFAGVKLSSPAGKCKAVYLTSLDPWDGQKNVKDDDKQINKFVYQCLEMAEKQGYTSIGIPAMGTGKIGYPHDLVAKYMYNVVEKFANSHKQSKLTDIKFVVHFKDDKSIKAFRTEEKSRLPPPPPLPVVPVPGQKGPHKFASGNTSGNSQVVVKSLKDNEFQLNKVMFTVEQGDILAKKCDAIVNGSNEDFDLTQGAVSKAIKKKCDVKKFDAEVAKKKDDMKQYGLATTSGCGLPAGHIIHISSKHNPRDWKTIIKKALYKAEKKQFKTLAFPALGTGAAGTDEEQMGRTIMESLVEFVGEGKTTNIEHVYLVIFQDKMVQNMLKGVRTGAKTALSPAKPGQIIQSDDKRKWSVSFTIYGVSKQDISKAKQLLDSAVADKYKIERHHDLILENITDNEIAFLKSIESNHPIKMTIDQVKCDVVMEGVLDDVMNAKQDVYDALRKFSHTRHCKAEAEIIKDQVQWYLKDIDDRGLPTLIEYPEMINMYLETAYKGESGRTEVEFKDDQGEEYVIVLKEMTEYLKKDRSNKVDVLRREKVQGEGGTFEPPPEWDEQGTDNVKLVTLLNTSQEYQSVEKKFIDSVFSGRPEWAKQFNKQTLKVTKIERIQNLSLYHMYAAKKALIEKQNPAGTQNEQELWHGTPEKAVVSINFYGFNRSYCSDNSKDAYWGEGVYFSKDASYSARGWLSAQNALGEHNIYLCKVLTGVHCQGKKGMRVLPLRQDGTMLYYDSATDANYTPTVEYVVFNDTQAYPQYCIKFKY